MRSCSYIVIVEIVKGQVYLRIHCLHLLLHINHRSLVLTIRAHFILYLSCVMGQRLAHMHEGVGDIRTFQIVVAGTQGIEFFLKALIGDTQGIEL